MSCSRKCTIHTLYLLTVQERYIFHYTIPVQEMYNSHIQHVHCTGKVKCINSNFHCTGKTQFSQYTCSLFKKCTINTFNTFTVQESYHLHIRPVHCTGMIPSHTLPVYNHNTLRLSISEKMYKAYMDHAHYIGRV